MDIHIPTIGLMAKKKQKDRHKSPMIGLRISHELMDKLRDVAKRNRRTLTAELTVALEHYLSHPDELKPAGK